MIIQLILQIEFQK